MVHCYTSSWVKQKSDSEYKDVHLLIKVLDFAEESYNWTGVKWMTTNIYMKITIQLYTKADILP